MSDATETVETKQRNRRTRRWRVMWLAVAEDAMWVEWPDPLNDAKSIFDSERQAWSAVVAAKAKPGTYRVFAEFPDCIKTLKVETVEKVTLA